MRFQPLQGFLGEVEYSRIPREPEQGRERVDAEGVSVCSLLLAPSLAFGVVSFAAADLEESSVPVVPHEILEKPQTVESEFFVSRPIREELCGFGRCPHVTGLRNDQLLLFVCDVPIVSNIGEVPTAFVIDGQWVPLAKQVLIEMSVENLGEPAFTWGR
jgi:hypothetical protein